MLFHEQVYQFFREIIIEKLDKYKQMLLSCSVNNCELIYEQVADCYENDLIEFGDYPEEYLQFFLDLLGEPEIYNKQGLWAFFLVVGTESHKLTYEAKAAIARALVANYPQYEDSTLCLSACDFIARYYDYCESEKILRTLDDIEHGKSLKGFAKDGLHTLYNGLSRIDSSKI